MASATDPAPGPRHHDGRADGRPDDGRAAPDVLASFRNRRIVVGVSGGIACYKIATVVSQLVQAGASVRVAMTESATRFVGPLTFQSLSGHTVLTSLWQSDDRPDSQHVGLARWCEMMIIAPATADVMARLAAGLTDDVVTLTACALPKGVPVLLAPAMNADMWANPIVQRNVATLKQIASYQTVGPDEGWQACRTLGSGRMSEPSAIVQAAAALLPAPSSDKPQ